MSIVPAINLQRLPFPELVTGQSVEVIASDLAQHCKAELAKHDPVIDLESPVLKALFQVVAGRERRLLAQINTTAQAVMLATASGSDLDQVAALYGVKRLMMPMDAGASSATETLMETDDRLRMRARLAMEVLSQTGCEGTYLFHALSASGRIKDVSVFESTQTPGTVRICLLSNQGDGGEKASDPLIRDAVEQALQDVRSVTDTIEVELAKIHRYTVKAQLGIAPYANADTVLPMVSAAVTELIHENHRLGKHLIRDEFLSAMYQDGVTEVVLNEPAADLAMDLDTAPYNSTDPEEKDPLLEFTIDEL